jgi:acyl carrier protein
MSDEVERQVLEAIALQTGLAVSDIGRTATLTDLGLSSMDALGLLFTFEEQLAVRVPDALIPRMRTVGELIAGLREVLADKERATTGEAP